VDVRLATEADREVLQSLWREFSGPLPPWAEGAEEETFAELDLAVRGGTAFVAVEAGEVVGFAAGLARGGRTAELTELFVRPQARRSGIGTRLARAVIEALHAGHVRVSVGVANQPARALYRRLGFEEEQLVLRRDAEAAGRATGETFGSVHIQTDDQGAVERAVRRFVPRISASRETIVSAPSNGWVAVYDEVANRDPDELRQLGAELSNVTGAVALAIGVELGQAVRYIAYDRGHSMDEYLSVPAYLGPVAPGDAVGLRANPTVMARLTGADPAALRRVARTAENPAALPPARELAAQIGAVLGLTGADVDFDEARGVEGAIVVRHR
jgi:ribosomal protein S18 acetylase RimI-like enzyme